MSHFGSSGGHGRYHSIYAIYCAYLHLSLSTPIYIHTFTNVCYVPINSNDTKIWGKLCSPAAQLPLIGHTCVPLPQIEWSRKLWRRTGEGTYIQVPVRPLASVKALRTLPYNSSSISSLHPVIAMAFPAVSIPWRATLVPAAAVNCRVWFLAPSLTGSQ